MVSLPGPASWRRPGSYVMDKYLTFELAFLKSPVIDTCPTEWERLNGKERSKSRPLQVLVSESRPLQVLVSKSCPLQVLALHIFHRQRMSTSVFGEEGGSRCILSVCGEPKRGRSLPPCLPYPTTSCLHWSLNPRLSECRRASVAELPGSTGCVFTESAPLPGLASERLQVHILTHLAGFILRLHRLLLLYQSERLVGASPSPRASSSLSNQIKSDSSVCKTEEPGLGPAVTPPRRGHC